VLESTNIAKIAVDPVTENEYYVLENVPFVGNMRMLKKETSTQNVILGGFLAGGAIELVNATLLHPIDTVKTRLQTNGVDGYALTSERLFDRLYDGFMPVLMTVPVLSVFWAVKDVVRRNIVGSITMLAPSIFGDVLATSIAATCGEAAYWAVKTPGYILKTKRQAAVELESKAARMAELEETSSESLDVISPEVTIVKDYSFIEVTGFIGPEPQTPAEPPLWEQSIKSWPLLAAVDVPQVALRTAIFVYLHDNPSIPSGTAGNDVLLFVAASTLAAVAATPLDVARTQLLLSGGTLVEVPFVLTKIQQEQGTAALMAGWQPRLLWNGLIVGATLGLCRLGYEDVRAAFLLNVLDKFEETIQPAFVKGLL